MQITCSEVSTLNVHVAIKKVIKKYKKTGNQRKNYKKRFESEIDSSSDGGWEEEDLFNSKLEKREENLKIINLQCKMWKLESMIVLAKREYAKLMDEP
ncbi:hypothetical protein pb186bvf_001155 [Paramecium bursaria]